MTRGLFVSILLLVTTACAPELRVRSELPLPYRQAEDSFRLGHYDRAVRGYRIFIQGDEYKELVPRAYYKMALAEFRRGEYAQCLQVLDELEAQYPRDRWPQVHQLRGDVEEERGNMVSAVRWWEEGWKIAEGDAKLKLRNQMGEALEGMSDESLKGAASVLMTSEMQDIANAYLKARATARSVASAARPGDTAEEGGVEAYRIACLLPLSGSYAAYGKRSLNGIRLALGSRGADLLIIDQAGEPQRARAGLDELIANREVIAVLGPLRSNVAEIVGPQAERAGLPMVLLSQREVLHGAYVLPLALTPDLQTSRVAEYAMRYAGLSRFGIVHPSDAYGTALADAFKREIEGRGGAIVGTIAYARDARDFAIEAVTVQRWKEQGGVQAVFIPDYAPTVVVLAPQLRAVVPDLVLLGSNGWNDAKQLAQAATELEGSVFVDGFFAGSQRPATRAFMAAYQAVYGSVPGILEAQAYDAATMLRRVLETGVQSRQGVVPRLQRLGDIEGAGGRIAFGSGGVQREVFLLTLRGGVVHELAAGSGQYSPADTSP